jgi:hypothetical protein
MASKSSSRTLTDHDEIRQWAEERGAKPSTVRRTHSDDNTGIIRLDFPGYSGQDSLEEISWDEWFDDFDDRKLALVVQDETANGQTSNFNKLVSRESVEDYSQETSSRGKRKTSSASSRGSGSSTKKSSGRTESRSSSRSSSRSASAKKSAGSESSGQKRRATGQSRQRSGSSRKKAA